MFWPGACRRKEEATVPNYTFVCEDCQETVILSRPFSVGPTPEACPCGGERKHDIRSDILSVEIDSSGCRDHNEIPREKRVYRPVTRAGASKVEAQYKRHIKQRRDQLKDGNQGSVKQTHAIPADLYHGKIRETRDKNYWRDKKNMSRHEDFKVG
jgi:hypothetical protein